MHNDLVAVQDNGCHHQDRVVQGAVLGEAANVAHAFPEQPWAVHNSDQSEGVLRRVIIRLAMAKLMMRRLVAECIRWFLKMT